MEDLAIRKDFTVRDNIFVNAMCELLGGSPSPGSVTGGDGWCREQGAGGTGLGRGWGHTPSSAAPHWWVNGRSPCPWATQMFAEGAKPLGEGVWGKLKPQWSSISLQLSSPGGAGQGELGSQHRTVAAERAGELHGSPPDPSCWARAGAMHSPFAPAHSGLFFWSLLLV